jgi:GntR family transcriptional regulator
MEMLVNDGMVERKQGVGTVVISNHPASAPDWISSCLLCAFDDGGEDEPAVKKVLSSSIVPAEEETAEALDVPVGTRLFRLDRLQCVGSHPCFREIDYLPESLAPHAMERDFQRESLRA